MNNVSVNPTMRQFIQESIEDQVPMLQTQMLRLMNLNKQGPWVDPKKSSRQKSSPAVQAFMDKMAGEFYSMTIEQGIVGTDDAAREAAMELVQQGLGTMSYAIRQEVAGDVVLEDRQYVPGDEWVNVLDCNYPVESPRHTQLKRSDQVDAGEVYHISQTHIDACSVLSNTLSWFDEEQFLICMGVKVKLDPEEQNDYMGSKSVGSFKKYFRMASGQDRPEIYIKQPLTNLDYRFRKYAIMLLSITGNKRIRSIHNAPSYAFTERCRDLMENLFIAKEGYTPDEAYRIGGWRTKQFVAAIRSEELTEAQIKMFRCYKKARDTGMCHYWCEIDAVASGIVNALMQLGHEWGVQIADINHPLHKHARKIYAEYLVEHEDYFASCDPDDPEFDAFIKLVLSPLMYGAMKQGVYKSLIGERWNEDEEVDKDLYEKASAFMKKLPILKNVDDPHEVNDILGRRGGLCERIGIAYGFCFPDLKAAMDKAIEFVTAKLEAGEIPEFTTASGGRCRLSMFKRTSNTGPIKFSYENQHGEEIKTQAWVSEKKTEIERLVTAAFSWLLHNTDAEIISLFTVRAGAADIPHFTNHDAIFCRLCDFDQVQRIFIGCVNDVNREQHLVKVFDCEPVGEFQEIPITGQALAA